MDHLSTRLSRAGTEPDPETGAVSPPIHLSSTFARTESGEPTGGYVYSRLENPTRSKLEEALADAESGGHARAFASGMAAAMTLLQALDPGDHVILPDDIYFGVRKLATGPFARWGLDVSHVDMSNNASLEAAFKPSTRMVWIETPSNPLLTVTDIAAVSKLAHYHHAHVVVDNTWPSPALTRPIEHGADIVLHSVTKYLGGHSDVLGGALIFEKEDDLFHRIVELQRDAGAVLDPFSSWLTLRGMRSLIPRITHQCASALYLANWLNEHSAVEAVHYPGLSSHPGHETAKRQMAAFGGMLSFRVQGGKPAALSIVNSSRLFTNATSLGGTESLMEHRASAEGDTSTTPDNLLRVSLGLESVEDLKADLEQALDRV